jgi:hypothetical protein
MQTRLDQLKKDGKKSAMMLVMNAQGDTQFVVLPLQ